MRLYDSHCHLDDDAFDPDRDDVVARARAAGVTAILVPGFDPSLWDGLPALAARHPEVRFAVGVHPFGLAADAPAAGLASRLADRAVALGAAAIGECGFDARTAKSGGASIETQRAVLEAHLDAARALALPIVLHGVHAHGPLLESLERFGPLPAGGALHGFTGPAELVPRYARLGLSFGLGPAILRPSARRPRDAARAVPADLLLVETDAPDMGWSREDRNEPARVAAVVAELAALRGEAAEDVAERTYGNAARLFGPADRAPAPVC